MKIAFIVGGFPKISETFILNQITGLIDLGHEVDIYANRTLRESSVHPEVLRYRLLERTHWFDLPQTRPARLARAVATFARRAPRHPRHLLRCLNIFRYKSLYAILNNVMRIAPFLDRSYDAIMCHYGTNGIDYIFLKDLFPELRFVTMFHAGDIRLGDEEGADVYARLREGGDVFLAISDSYNRRKLLEFGFSPERIRSHRIGVAVRDIAYRPRPEPTDTVRVLTVARLDPEKGLDIGIRAVARLIALHPSPRIAYTIVGDGVLKPMLENLIRELHLSDTVSLLGPLPTAAVLEQMHRAHIFMLPSLAEATPTVLLEAQATGMPVVATDVGAVAEIVASSRAGFVVPPNDPEALLAALKRLIDRPEEWEKIAHAGRLFVEERHDIVTLNLALAGVLDGRGDRRPLRSR